MHLLKVPPTYVGALESPNLDTCLSTYGCGQPSTQASLSPVWLHFPGPSGQKLG